MKGEACSRLKKENIIMEPRTIQCLEQGVLFLTKEGTFDRLDEDQILLAYIEQKRKDGKETIRPPVQDVTAKTEGRFFLGTVYGTRCEIRTNAMQTTAGELMMEIAEHYPWLWIGTHACLDTKDKRKWEELREMVETMRECSRLF